MRDLTGHATFSFSDSVFPPRFLPAPLLPMNEGVVLGFDFGMRRIGVAIGNSVTREARPLQTIEAVGEARWNALGVVIARWQPVQLVVGIPCHPDGAHHAMTASCERFARQLEGRSRLPVARVDERYSSAVVERAEDVDAAAAAIIVQQWFDTEAPDA